MLPKTLKVKEKIYIEKYYLWLSHYCNVDFSLLEKLVKVFSNVENIYKISKSNFLFKEYLSESNIKVPEEIYFSLVNSKLKEKADVFYNKLTENGICVISCADEKYKELFYNLKQNQLCFFAVGDERLLESKKKVMVYSGYSKGKSAYIRELEEAYSSAIDKNSAVEVEFLDNLDYIKSGKIYIINFKVTSDTLKVLSSLKLKDTLLLFSKYNFTKTCEEFNLFFASNVFDRLIVLEAEYNNKNVNFIDWTLENSKDIFVVPGNILSLSNYFSNYLIRQGADMILSKSDIEESLKFI